MPKLTRDEVIRKMREAVDLERIAEAQEAVVAWLAEHPDDREIRGEAEGLGMRASALRHLEEQKPAA